MRSTLHDSADCTRRAELRERRVARWALIGFLLCLMAESMLYTPTYEGENSGPHQSLLD